MSTRLPSEAVNQAASWMARLWAEDASAEDRQACQRWREAAIEHEVAWQHLQRAQQRFANLGEQGVGSQVLRRDGVSRRQVLAFGGLALGGAALLGTSSRTSFWQQSLADQRTAAGELRQLALSDGSLLYLNTRTRLDLDDTPQQQHLHLYEGELLLDMSARNSNRPLRLNVAGGVLLPNRARLALRHTDGMTRASLYRGDARWQVPGGMANVDLRVGETSLLQATLAKATGPALDSDLAWLQGKLVAERMPLDRFVNELGRYRPGLLRAEPSLARYQVSGVFSVHDTDLALDQLTRILPVRITRFTRYWAQVSAA